MFKRDDTQDRLVAAARTRCDEGMRKALQAGRSGDFGAMDRVLKLVREEVRNPKLPRDFVSGVLQRTKRLEQDCYQLAIDQALTEAMQHAQDKQDAKRNDAIKKARDFLGKALAAGADHGFREAAQRKIDIIMFSGKDQSVIAGLVKPVSRNDPMTNRSKNEKRYYKRFSHPVLDVLVDGHTYPTVDWSMGGMLIGGYDGSLQPDAEINVSFGPNMGIPRYGATVKVVKRTGAEIAVKFIRANQDSITYLRRLIQTATPAR